MPAIPDRWIPYKACGNVIEGTRLICFKVPLRKKVQQWNNAIKEIWDIQALLEKVPKLGAVIDLTNTSRYYDPADLEAAGVLHKKILMPGRELPPENKVTEFMDAVDEFLRKDCEFLVGVHCTHGLNRTGYMVCRYMRDRLGIPGKDAIKRFETARGYQIERKNYVNDLLGMKPPPPDLGKETEIKPVSKYSADKRSPLAEDEEFQDRDHQRDRYGRSNDRFGRDNDRYGNRRYYGNDSRSSERYRRDSDRSNHWRSGQSQGDSSRSNCRERGQGSRSSYDNRRD